MSDKTESVRVGSFWGVTSDGQRIRIHAMKKVIVVRTRGGTTRADGLTYFVTDDGDPVKKQEDGTYLTAFGFVVTPEKITGNPGR